MREQAAPPPPPTLPHCSETSYSRCTIRPPPHGGGLHSSGAAGCVSGADTVACIDTKLSDFAQPRTDDVMDESAPETYLDQTEGADGSPLPPRESLASSAPPVADLGVDFTMTRKHVW